MGKLSSAWSHLLVLLALLALGTLAGVAAGRTPTPAAASGAPTEFAAARAMADVRAIAVRPHPMGSSEHARVADYLQRRMVALGLHTERQRRQVVASEDYPGLTVVQGGEVDNVVGVLPGRDRSLQPLLLVAHYDTVPNSPGAGDNSANVSVILEVLRALVATGPQKRDVVVLFSDGEDAGGLLGARAFFAYAPIAKDVGLVLNLEARGQGGRTLMFETSRGNGGLIRSYSAAGPGTVNHSLMPVIYGIMPNDSDFSVAKANGLNGLNFAFIGRPYDYHRATASVDRLEPGAVQSMGQAVLAATRAFANAEQLPNRSPDVTYTDLMGGPTLVYPATAGWVLLALSAVLLGISAWRLRSSERLEIRSVLRASGAGVLVLLGTVVAISLPHNLLAWSSDPTSQAAVTARHGLLALGVTIVAIGGALLVCAWSIQGLKTAWLAPTAIGGLALVSGLADGVDLVVLGAGVVAALLAFACFRRGFAYWTGWVGLWTFLFVVAVVLQVLLPTVAFVIEWTLLAAAVAAAVLVFLGWSCPRLALMLVGLLGVATSAFLTHLYYPIFLAVGVNLPEVIASVAVLGLVVFYPLAAAWSESRWSPYMATGLVGGGVAMMVAAAAMEPDYSRWPKPTHLVAVAGPGEGMYRTVSASPRLDPWELDALRAKDDAPAKARFPILSPHPLWAAKTSAFAVPQTTADTKVVHVGHRAHVEMALTSDPNGRQRRFVLQAEQALEDLTLNGAVVRSSVPLGRAIYAEWNGGEDKLVVSFKAPARGRAHLDYASIVDGLPRELAVPSRPESLTPRQDSDITAVMKQLNAAW